MRNLIRWIGRWFGRRSMRVAQSRGDRWTSYINRHANLVGWRSFALGYWEGRREIFMRIYDSRVHVMQDAFRRGFESDEAPRFEFHDGTPKPYRLEPGKILKWRDRR